MFPQVSPKASSRQSMLSQGTNPPPNCKSSGSVRGARGFRKHLGSQGFVVAPAVKDRWGVQGRRGQRQEESLVPIPPCTASHLATPTYRGSL